MPMLTKCPNCGFVGSHGFTRESGIFDGDFGTIYHSGKSWRSSDNCQFKSGTQIKPSELELSLLSESDRKFWDVDVVGRFNYKKGT